MNNFYRKNVLEMERVKEEREAELNKKMQYKKLLDQQYEEQKKKKQEELEAKRKKELEIEEKTAKQQKELERRFKEEEKKKKENLELNYQNNNSHNISPSKSMVNKIEIDHENDDFGDLNNSLPEVKKDLHNIDKKVDSPVHPTLLQSQTSLKKSIHHDLSDPFNNLLAPQSPTPQKTLNQQNTLSINTSLSKNYIRNYKESRNYKHICDDEDSLKRGGHFRNMSKFLNTADSFHQPSEISSEHKKIKEQEEKKRQENDRKKSELESLIKESIRITKERDTKLLELIELKENFMRLEKASKQDLVNLKSSFQGAKSLIEESQIAQSFFKNNPDLTLNCDTTFRWIEDLTRSVVSQSLVRHEHKTKPSMFIKKREDMCNCVLVWEVC